MPGQKACTSISRLPGMAPDLVRAVVLTGDAERVDEQLPVP
jgi:hypothetical protein